MPDEPERTQLKHEQRMPAQPKPERFQEAPGEAEADVVSQAILAGARPHPFGPARVLPRLDGAARAQAITQLQQQRGNASVQRLLRVQRQLPPYASGGSLPSPSYVSGTPAASLTGGPTASAGESQFVVGGAKKEEGRFDWSGLLASAGKLKSAFEKFDGIAKVLQKKGAGGFLGYGEKKPLLVAADNLVGFAKGLTSLGDALAKSVNHPDAGTITKADKAAGYAGNVVNAAQAISNLADASASLKAFEANPDQESAEKWADDVGNAFDGLSKVLDVIPSEGLPGFIMSYYKGLLSAPKNYISAFKTIMHAHYAKIDLEAGISGAKIRATQGDKIMWEGLLTHAYIQAFFVDNDVRAKAGKLGISEPQPNLAGFMKAHQKDLGADLYKTSKEVGKALLIGAIQREIKAPTSPFDPVDLRTQWVDFLNNM